ncbi:MAG TPA: T9SS type A sorting domain-containing protein [Niastella sp.]
MKKQFLLLVCSSLYFITATAQIVFSAANNFTQTGGYLVLRDINLVNNGTFNPAGGTVRFSGAANNSISGATNPAFNILEVNKNTGNQVSLQNNISINSYISFLSGLIALSGNNVVLNGTAYLNNETEASRITGTTGGYVQATVTLNAPAAANPGNLGAVISTAQNPGITVIRRGHVSQQNTLGNGNSIYRYYDILPATVPTSFNLRLNYLDAELNGLNEGSLTLVKRNNNLEWHQQGFTSRNTTTNYVEYNSITSYDQRWTLTTIDNILPLELLSFAANCKKTNAVELKWTTADDMNSGAFEVQRSNDGIQWQTIDNRQTGSGNQYSYTDPLPGKGTMYRLKMVAEGNITYSAIRTPGCALTSANALVYPSPATSYLQVQLNNMPNKELVLMLYSNRGQLLQIKSISMTGSFETFTLPLAGLPAGAYQLSIQSPGYKKTVAFVKQ